MKNAKFKMTSEPVILSEAKNLYDRIRMSIVK